jgi:hypothetical protein
MTTINVDLMLKYQNMAIDLEKNLKSKYANKFAKQLINGAKDAVNYSYGKDKDVEWYVKYVRELEKRV